MAALLPLCAGCDQTAGARGGATKYVPQVYSRILKPPAVKLPTGLRYLSIREVTETRTKDDNLDGAPICRAALAAALSDSPYIVLDEDIFGLLKSGVLTKYAARQTGIRSDYLNEVNEHPERVGVISVELASAMDYTLSWQNDPQTLNDYDYSRGAIPNIVPRESVQVVSHTITIKGAVDAVVRIHSAKDQSVVFEKKYHLDHQEGVGKEGGGNFFALFSPKAGGFSGDAPPTLTEFKTALMIGVAETFAKEISPTYVRQMLQPDPSGDPLAANLVRAGALRHGELRLQALGARGGGDATTQPADVYNLGVIYEAEGYFAEAASQYKAALNRQPHNRLYRESAERAERMINR